MTFASASARVDNIRHSLVGLKMPRALEMLDATLRRIEQGEIDGIEAIDDLLAEELSLRENRRVKAALRMARLPILKTLAGFDFSFQPSLDRNRIMALAGSTLSSVPRSSTCLGRQAPANPISPRHSPSRPFAPAKAFTSSRWPILSPSSPKPNARARCARKSASYAAVRCSSSTKSATCPSPPAAATCSSSSSTPAMKKAR